MATPTVLTVLLSVIFLKERNFIPQKVLGGVFAVTGTILLLQ